MRVNAAGGVRANAKLHFLHAADEGDVVDQFLGERGGGPGAVPARPAFQEFPRRLLVAAPCEEPVVDRIGIVRGVPGPEAVVGRLLVVGDQHDLAVDDLHILPVLSGPRGADLDVLHHLRQRFGRPQVEDDAIAVLGRHLDHLRSQRGEI